LSRNLGNLTSWNSLGLSRPVMGLLYLFTCVILILDVIILKAVYLVVVVDT